MHSTEVCALCRGAGWYYDEEERERTCRCERLRRMRLCLERHGLGDVKPGRKLLSDDLDPKQGNLLIRARWEAFKTHLAGWLIASYPRNADVRVHLTDDTEIRNLRMGDRGEGADASGSLMAGLGKFDLVVVRLRPASKHGANVGAIVEAIDRSEMMWIVESPTRPIEKHAMWCSELEDVLDEEGFERLDLTDSEEPDVTTKLFGGQR